MNLADAAFEAATALTSPPSRKELRAAEHEFEAAVKAFIETAAAASRCFCWTGAGTRIAISPP